MAKHMKKFTIILSSIILVTGVLSGCSQNPEEKSNNSTTSTNKNDSTKTKENNSYSGEYLTSLESFKTSMSNENTVILDARGEEAYAKGHIKGAIPVAWQSFTNQEGKSGDKDWGTVLPKEELAKKLSEIGVNKDKTVFVYGSKEGWGEDGRIVWMLRMAGIKATMLNGGLELWESENNEIVKDTTEPTSSETTIESLDQSMNITTDELKKDYDRLTIVDVRAKEEYDGATKYGETRGGHLPKAQNINFSEVYNEDGTIKKIDELKKLFEKKGLKTDSTIVTYCTAGIRSAHLALVLKEAGYENVKNYDASYYEWAGDNTNKVE